MWQKSSVQEFLASTCFCRRLAGPALGGLHMYGAFLFGILALYGHMIACMTLGVTGDVGMAIGDFNFMCDWGLGMILRLWLVGGNDVAMGG